MMCKRKKIIAIILGTMVMASSLTACGSSSGSGDQETLTVWSHLSSGEVDALQEVVKKWGDENNVEVKLVEDQGKMQEYKEVANSASGPDLYYGIGHDNLGTFVKADLLAEVPEGTIKESDYTGKNVIDAVTVNGKQYAVPISQETTALFINKDKVAEAPKTMEEVAKVGKEKGFMFEVTNFYISKALVTPGTYIFKNNNGTLDPNDIGLDTENAVKGYQYLADMVKDGLVAPDITDDVAKDQFKQKNTAFYISGPWNVKEVKDAGVNLQIVPLPTLGGNELTPYSTIQAAFVSKNSKKQDLAWKLLKYLNENDNDILVNTGNRIPALKSGVESEAFKKNEVVSVFADAVKNSEPMPNIPEVQATWDPAKNNIFSMLSGQIDAATCAKNTVDQIKQAEAQLK